MYFFSQQIFFFKGNPFGKQYSNSCQGSLKHLYHFSLPSPSGALTRGNNPNKGSSDTHKDTLQWYSSWGKLRNHVSDLH